MRTARKQERKDSKTPDSALRLQAEAQLARAPNAHEAGRSVEELLHELQVHQIELELQNEELRLAHVTLEESRDRYLDLYEFAPIGYLRLGRDTVVQEINLTGAALLKRDRAKIIGRRFARFILSEDQDRYYRMVAQVMKLATRRSFPVRLQHEEGASLHVQMDCVFALQAGGQPGIRVTLTDISELKRAEARIETLAFYDPLTGLPNRRLLLERLERSLNDVRNGPAQGAVLFVDLDDFKTLNDTQGHHAGDLLLQEAARRLCQCVRSGDTVARLGGDEFVIVLEDLNTRASETPATIKLIGEKILRRMTERYQLADYEYRGSASMGISLFSENHDSIDDLLKRADLALYRAKAAGRGHLRFFNPEMQAAANARAMLEIDLRRGLLENQFVLLYQPQVDLLGHVVGAEALVRWNHPTLGLRPPGEFVSFAEEKGLIAAIGHWVLEAACLQILAWSADPRTVHLKLAVNISAHEFCHPEFVPRVLTMIDRVRISLARLVIEITESVMLNAMPETLTKITALKARGIFFSLDDFGIGYSSLSYLKELPLDQMKIDHSFVRDVLVNPKDASIARNIIALGESLGIQVIAEGVETSDQRDFLASHGCTAFQGFYFGRPAPPSEILLTVAQRAALPV